MRWIIFVLSFVFLSGFCFVGATGTEIVMVGDIGSFSGAVLRVVSPVSGEVGDKIYASEYLTKAGVIKFDIETSFSEVSLNIVVTKDGVIVDTIEEGPFAVDGSRITIDRREGINRTDEEVLDVEVESEVVERVVEVPTASDSAALDVSVEVAFDDNEEIIVDVEGNEGLFEEGLNTVLLTGRAVFVREDGSVNVGSAIGGSVFSLMFIVFAFMMIRRRGGKVVTEILSEDDKELDYMEKKVRATEGRISKIKNEREKRSRIAIAKVKLAKEKRELRELERMERKESERIEDL